MPRITAYRFQWLVYGTRDLNQLPKLILLRIALGVVAMPKDADGWLTISHQTIADDIGASRTRVSAALKQLTADGWLEYRQPVSAGRYTTAAYRLPAANWQPGRVSSEHTEDGATSRHDSPVHVASGDTDRVASGDGFGRLRRQRVRSTHKPATTRPPAAESQAKDNQEVPAQDRAVPLPRDGSRGPALHLITSDDLEDDQDEALEGELDALAYVRQQSAATRAAIAAREAEKWAAHELDRQQREADLERIRLELGAFA